MAIFKTSLRTFSNEYSLKIFNQFTTPIRNEGEISKDLFELRTAVVNYLVQAKALD